MASMKNVIGQMALLAAIQAAFPKPLIDRLVSESQEAAEAKGTRKDAGDEATETSGTLLQTVREVGGYVLTQKGWNRGHFEAALALAVTSGADESSISAYSSTVGSYIAAAQRETDPLPAEALTDPGVKYKALREMLKSQEDRKLSESQKEARSFIGWLNQKELDILIVKLSEQTKERREAAEAKKAATAAKKAHQPEAAAEMVAEAVAGDGGNVEVEQEQARAA